MPEQQDPFGGNCQSCEESVLLDPCQPSCDDKECTSKGDAFFDKTLEDFNFPKTGSDAKIFVCDPSYWSSCMWVVGCGPQGLFYLKILTVNKKDGYLLAYNGCDTQPIETNPDAGVKIQKGTVIFPGAYNCSNASGCETVKDCISAAEELCFEKIPEDDENIEYHHLFAGTAERTQDPSIWKSCLRKIRKIFLGKFGRTLCFDDLPTLTDEISVVNGVDYPKHILYFDSLGGCMGKGPTIGGALGCNVPKLDLEDEFSLITICKDGTRLGLEPECGKEFYPTEDDEGNKIWKWGDPPWPEYIAPIELVDAGYTTTRDLEYDLSSYEVPCWAKYAEVYVLLEVTAPSGQTSAIILSRYVDATKTIPIAYTVATDASHQDIGVAKVPIINGKIKFRYGYDAGSSARRVFIEIKAWHKNA